MNEHYIQDSVILKIVDGEVKNVIRKNGKVEYYKCKRMLFFDHVKMLKADVPEVKTN